MKPYLITRGNQVKNRITGGHLGWVFKYSRSGWLAILANGAEIACSEDRDTSALDIYTWYQENS